MKFHKKLYITLKYERKNDFDVLCRYVVKEPLLMTVKDWILTLSNFDKWGLNWTMQRKNNENIPIIG